MKKEHIVIVLVAFLVAVCVALDVAFATRFAVSERKEETTAPETTTEPETTVPEPETTEPPETTPPPYESPIDFVSFKEQNEHIYAWIDIPNSSISQPILQHPTDKDFYNRRDLDKNYSVYGSIFTEAKYNSTLFDDPVTMIYGHHTWNSLMFGDLQTIYKEEIGECDEIVIYMPEKELHYQVFAAVVHNDLHVLYYNDFSDPDGFNRFFDGIFAKSGNYITLDKECTLTPEDKVIILSTCFNGDTTHRYLVMAKLVETIE